MKIALLKCKDTWQGSARLLGALTLLVVDLWDFAQVPQLEHTSHQDLGIGSPCCLAF